MSAESVNNPVAARDLLSDQWIDLRLISGMRVILGMSALLISMLGTDNTWPSPSDIALVLYSFYGVVIYHLSARRNPIAAYKIHPLAGSAVVPAVDRFHRLPTARSTISFSSR